MRAVLASGSGKHSGVRIQISTKGWKPSTGCVAADVQCMILHDVQDCEDLNR